MTVPIAIALKTPAHARNACRYIDDERAVLQRGHLIYRLDAWREQMRETAHIFGNDVAPAGCELTLGWHVIIPYNPDDCALNGRAGVVDEQVAMAYAEDFLEREFRACEWVQTLHREHAADGTDRYCVHAVVGRTDVETGRRHTYQHRGCRQRWAREARELDVAYGLKRVVEGQRNSVVHPRQSASRAVREMIARKEPTAYEVAQRVARGAVGRYAGGGGGVLAPTAVEMLGGAAIGTGSHDVMVTAAAGKAAPRYTWRARSLGVYAADEVVHAAQTEREKIAADPVLQTSTQARRDLNAELDQHVEEVARVAQNNVGSALRRHYNWLSRWRQMVERWRTRLTRRRAEMADGLAARRVRAHARLAEAARGKTSQTRSVFREACELLQVEHWRPLNDRLTDAERAVERMPIGAQYDHMTRQLARLNEAAGMLCRQGLWSWSAIEQRQAELRAAVTIASARLHDRRLDADTRADLEYALKLAQHGLQDLDTAVARERWCDAMVARLAGDHLTAEQHAALETDVVDLPGYIDRSTCLNEDDLDDILDIIGDGEIAMEMRRQELTAAASAVNENRKTQQYIRTKGDR